MAQHFAPHHGSGIEDKEEVIEIHVDDSSQVWSDVVTVYINKLGWSTSAFSVAPFVCFIEVFSVNYNLLVKMEWNWNCDEPFNM